MQNRTLNLEEMSTIEGGMPCWLAVGLALGTAAFAGASCTTVVACAGGVLASAYAYDTATTACGI
jgi:hypothetical protein